MLVGMRIEIGTREELMVSLTAALAPGQSTRLLVVFRLGGFEEFVGRYGYGATDALMSHIASRLPDASGPASFYYRPRKNELCAIISGRVDGVEGVLAIAARDVHETLKPSGISLGFGTAVLPHEGSDPIEVLALADSRLTGIADGEPMPRTSAGDEQASQGPAHTGVLRPS
jgi:GGDEF domain-containing protein